MLVIASELTLKFEIILEESTPTHNNLAPNLPPPPPDRPQSISCEVLIASRVDGKPNGTYRDYIPKDISELDPYLSPGDSSRPLPTFSMLKAINGNISSTSYLISLGINQG